VRNVTERGPVINQEPYQNPELGEYKGSVGSCARIVYVSASCFPEVINSIRLQR